MGGVLSKFIGTIFLIADNVHLGLKKAKTRLSCV